MFGLDSKRIKLFTWLGIPVYLHWSFFLIFLYVLYIGYSEDMSTLSILWLGGFFLAMFGCVLLHEYGHALAARRYQVSTHDIILTPLGGMARLTRIPEKPFQEFVVAIAGPLVNVAIALVLYLIGKMVFRGDSGLLFSSNLSAPNLEMHGLQMFIPLMIWTNMSLFFFNLLPAFPMDGGRILRSLMALKFGRIRATKFAMWLGQAMAFMFIAYGLYSGNFILVLIGLFVISTAKAEYRQVRDQAILRTHTVREITRVHFTKLSPHDLMHTAYEQLFRGHERSFLVVDVQDQIVGYLAEHTIVKAKQDNSLGKTVEQFMTQAVNVISSNENLEHVQALLAAQQDGILIVLDPETREIIGVVDEQSVEYFLYVHERIL